MQKQELLINGQPLVLSEQHQELFIYQKMLVLHFILQAFNLKSDLMLVPMNSVVLVKNFYSARDTSKNLEGILALMIQWLQVVVLVLP